MKPRRSVLHRIDKLKGMKPEDDWGDKFYAALEALEDALGQPVTARPIPPHVFMAELIEHVAWTHKET